MGSWRRTLCVRLTLCAGAVLATAFTSTAYASDSGVSVVPASPAAGSDIQLRAAGCAGTTGTAVSTAFVSDARLTGQGGVLVGETRVRSSATSGAYDVTVSCDGHQDRDRGQDQDKDQDQDQDQDQVKGTFTVSAPGGPTAAVSPGIGSIPSVPGIRNVSGVSSIPGVSAIPGVPTVPGASAVPASPVAPVHAGGGGTAHFASVDVRSAGPGTKQTVIGLVLASVAAVAVAVRSARRGRGTRD